MAAGADEECKQCKMYIPVMMTHYSGMLTHPLFLLRSRAFEKFKIILIS